jgi:hypothetical protein
MHRFLFQSRGTDPSDALTTSTSILKGQGKIKRRKKKEFQLFDIPLGLSPFFIPENKTHIKDMRGAYRRSFNFESFHCTVTQFTYFCLKSFRGDELFEEEEVFLRMLWKFSV